MKTSALLGAAAVLLSALVPAAAGAQSKPQAYHVMADVVHVQTCVIQQVFNPGDTIVWRADVTDPAGVRVPADKIAALGITAVVSLKDGTKVPLRFGVHPPVPSAPAHDSYWAGSYHIAADHPTGSLPWTLTVADKAGNTVVFTPIGQSIDASVLTIAQKGAPAPAH